MYQYIVSNLDYDLQDGNGTRRLFEDYCARFESGTLTALTGPSGCGKTTLLSILGLFEKPTKGGLTYDGASLDQLTDAEKWAFRRRELGLVFQTCRLIPTLTAREHLSLSCDLRQLPRGSELDGLELLDRLGLSHRLDALPASLSGGEKQRLALAQTLLAKPRLLLADEPTAALDAANAIAVRKILRDAATAAIVVVVTHDPSLIDDADEVQIVSTLAQSVLATDNRIPELVSMASAQV